jgi:alpha 1,3-glucosidase
MSLSCVNVVVVLSLSLLVHMASSVERSKFRTCEQTAFCVRQRALRTDSLASRDSYRVVSSSDDATPNELRFGLEVHRDGAPKAAAPRLAGSVAALSERVVRVAVSDLHSQRVAAPRDEVIVAASNATATPPRIDAHARSLRTGDVVVNVKSHGAFGIEVRDAHSDALLVDVGARQLFQFEYVRARDADDVPATIVKADAAKPATWDDDADGPWQAPTEPNPAAESRWSESFGGATDNKRNGPTSVGADVRFAAASHVYGIPEHATSFSLKPTIVGGVVSADPYRLYNLDVFEYELNNNMALYGSVPFLIAHSAARTVGFLWLNPSETWIDVEKDGARGGVDTHWYSESGTLEFYVLVGPTPRDVLAQYAFLTGATPLPPMFAIAYHQCKWNYKNEEEVLAVNAGFNEHEMPMDVIWLDIEHTDGKRYFTWNAHAFPDPQRMLRAIGDDRRYMVTIVDPHIKRDTNYAVHSAAEAAGVYVRDANGASYEGHCWPGSSSWVDYTDASGRRWWAERFKYDQYTGSSDRLFIWNDMNEPSVFSGPEVTMHKTALHKHDIEHREVHNIYGMLMHRATWEGLLLRDNNERRPFLLTRAFFAGSQRYGAVWTGDNKADWSHLQASTPMLLALGVAGISFAGADVGGFFGDAGVELLTRWYQTAAFQPFFREHGHLDTRRKEPFLFDEPHRSAMRDALRTRYALLPYWYTTFRQGVDSGLPVMRGMFVAFPRETALFDEEQQFMVGDALLVLPVTREKATTETVVLPGVGADNVALLWYDRATAARYDGGTRVPYDVSDVSRGVPVLQRGGTIVAEQRRARRSSSAMAGDPYTLVVALDRAGGAAGELYVDDGATYANERRSAFVYRRFVIVRDAATRASLRSLAVEQAGAASDADAAWRNAVVERVVVSGLRAAQIKSVVARTVDGRRETLEFNDDASTQHARLIVHRPQTPIAQDWSIDFQLN